MTVSPMLPIAPALVVTEDADDGGAEHVPGDLEHVADPRGGLTADLGGEQLGGEGAHHRAHAQAEEHGRAPSPTKATGFEVVWNRGCRRR